VNLTPVKDDGGYAINNRDLIRSRYRDDAMYKYEYKINESGEMTSGTLECENNEDCKRSVKKRLKELGIPKGKYVFVDIVRMDDNKPIVTDELWEA